MSSVLARLLRPRRVITGVVVGILVAAGLAIGIPAVVAAPREQVVSAPGPRSSGSSAQASPGMLVGVHALVHVVGAVVHPGLVTLEPGSRVIDAIMAAGGLTARANQCGVNLARPVTDGEQIIVPSVPAGTTACVITSNLGATAGAGVKAKLSLSQAAAAELEQLPGVGPALAARIVDWRSAHGGFRQVSDLDNVSGIGPKLLAELSPLVVP